MTKAETIELINRRCGFNVHNGIKVSDFDDDCCVVEGELGKEALNPMGMAHGGFIYSLCDVAAGVAVGKGGRSCVTLSGSVRYLRPSKGGRLRAEGRIVKDGRSVVFVETSVYDDEGTLTAKGDFEIFVIQDKKVTQA